MLGKKSFHLFCLSSSGSLDQRVRGWLTPFIAVPFFAASLAISVEANAGPSPCLPIGGPTVSVGDFISGGSACWPALGVVNAGCTTLTFPATQSLGAFTEHVTITGGAGSCTGSAGLVPRGAVITFTGVLGSTGYALPKWQVVGVVYAPPGAKSTVTYATNFLSGTSESVSQSFTNAVTVKATAEGTLTNPSGVGGGGGGSQSAGWSQETDSTSTVGIQEQDGSSLIVPGPISSAVGVDHDYDQIFIWLNPALSLAVYPPNVVNFQGFAYDQRDTITGIDTIELTVGQLKGTQTISSDVQARITAPGIPSWGHWMPAILRKY